MSEFFDFLLGQLNDNDRLVQARAAQLLGGLGDTAAVDPLIKYVSDCRYHCKTVGFYALAELLTGEEPQMETLCELADEPNCEDDDYWIGRKSVRAAASLSLLTLGEAYGEKFLSELAESGDSVFYAWFAPAILSLEGDLPDITRLQRYLTVKSILKPNDTNSTRLTEPGPLAMVAEALGIIASDEALLALQGLLSFRSRYVRGAAVLALANADPDAPSEAAIEQVAVDGQTDFEKVRAAEAMCIIGREQYAGTLCEMVKTLPDDTDRQAAVVSLSRVDDELAIDAASGVFMTALADKAPCVRAAAIEALDNCGCEDIEPIAKLYSDDSDVYVRMHSAAMLALRGGA